MNLPRKFLKFDYGVHLLIGGLAILFIVLIPLTEGASFFLLFPLWPLIGAWQLLSALVMTFGYHDERRFYYLLAVVVYFVVLWLFSSSSIPYAEYGIFASFGFAIWYAYLTYKDATYRTPSFWDLEF